MKQIRPYKTFTLQVHAMDKRIYKANEIYEVDDAIADNWWTRAHAEVLGEPTPEKIEPTETVEAGVKKPVAFATYQKPLETVTVPKKSKAKEEPSGPLE